jgi:hypothetical protein
MGMNASNPPIHPGIHIPSNNTNINENEKCVNNPKITHMIKETKPVSDALNSNLVLGRVGFFNDVCTARVCFPSKYCENLKNLFNVLPPIS